VESVPYVLGDEQPAGAPTNRAVPAFFKMHQLATLLFALQYLRLLFSKVAAP
jgi:hypothetical protein